MKNTLTVLLCAICAQCFAAELAFEGESGEGATIEKDARASGGLVAAKLGRERELVFRGVKAENAGMYTLTLETFDSQVRSVGVSVNGGKFDYKQIAPGYDNTCGVGTFLVKLKAGENEIRFANSGGIMPNIDRWTLAPAIDVADAPGRFTIALNDGWQFKWGRDKGNGDWRTVDLPHDAQFEQPWTRQGTNGARGFKPMGEMWYRRTFETPAEAKGRRVWLEFGGILCIADVYVNGVKVAETDYGYLPVAADITDVLRPTGSNVVEVWCSTGKPGGSRWYTGAGLYRDAKLVVKPQIAIARNGVFARASSIVPPASCLVPRNGAKEYESRGTNHEARTIAVTVQLDGFRGQGGSKKLDVVCDIRDAEGNVKATMSERAPWSKNDCQEVELSGEIEDVVRWDIYKPYLYTAEVRLVLDGREIDRESVHFGVKDVELDAEYGFRINGRKVFLASVSGHHDLGAVGVAAYRRAIRRQFEMLKEFGFNAIRCSHNPYSEDFYEIADDMGILVMDELIDKWSDNSYWFGRRPFTAIWPQLVTEWMKRDRNHASIFAWSFGNEFQMRNDLCGYEGLNDWGVTMYRVIKALSERWDTTRPTTCAMFPSRAGAVYKTDPGFMDDPQAPELSLVTDFAALNYQSDVYGDYVRNAPGLNIFQSEAEMNRYLVPYWNMDRAHSIGCSWWGAVEYWGESNKWPKKGWNYSIFSHTLEPFPTAWLIKSGITKEPVVRIAVKTGAGESVTWNDVQVGAVSETSAWEGKAGETKTVRVYTNQKEVELFLNGKSLGVKRNDSKKKDEWNILTYAVPFEAGELTAKAGDISHTIRTAGDVVELQAEVEADDYRADGQDLIYVRCRAVDAKGVQVRSWKGSVEFSCEGAAKFLACDNGDHYTDELFAPEINAKNAKEGFMLAIFRCGTEPGAAKITIRPEGLPEVVKTVQVGK